MREPLAAAPAQAGAGCCQLEHRRHGRIRNLLRDERAPHAGVLEESTAAIGVRLPCHISRPEDGVADEPYGARGPFPRENSMGAPVIGLFMT